MSGDVKEKGEIFVKDRVKLPPKYKVMLHNDDYTTMDFVIDVLTHFFGKSQDEAESIMMKVHLEGVGICGVYSFEVAETKVFQVSEYSRANKWPLKCTMEPE